MAFARTACIALAIVHAASDTGEQHTPFELPWKLRPARDELQDLRSETWPLWVEGMLVSTIAGHMTMAPGGQCLKGDLLKCTGRNGNGDRASIPCMRALSDADDDVCFTTTIRNTTSGEVLSSFASCEPASTCKVTTIKSGSLEEQTEGCCKTNECNPVPAQIKTALKCNYVSIDGGIISAACGGSEGSQCWSGTFTNKVTGASASYGGCTSSCDAGTYSKDNITLKIDKCCSTDHCNAIPKESKNLLTCNTVDNEGVLRKVVCPPAIMGNSEPWESPTCLIAKYNKNGIQLSTGGCVPKEVCTEPPEEGTTVSCCDTDRCNKIDCAAAAGLSTTRIVVIVVVAALIVLSICGVAALMFARRRRTVRAADGNSMPLARGAP